MTKQGKLDRGKKWIEVKRLLTLANSTTDLDWMDSQAIINEDIKAYEDSLNPPKEVKEVKETKSKKEK